MLLKPDSCVVADADYGDNPNFLAGLETRQEQYVVGVRTDFAVSLRRAGTSRRCRADELLQTVPRWQWRTIRWRRGTKGWLRKKFVALRCWRITSAGQRHEGWLLGERATRGQPEERKYFWSNLPAETTLEELAGYAHRRVLRKNWILTFFQAKAAKNFSQESNLDPHQLWTSAP